MIFHYDDEFTSIWWNFISLRKICHSIDFFFTLVNKLFSLNFSFGFLVPNFFTNTFNLFPIFIYHFVLPLFKMNFITNKCGSGHRKLRVCVVKSLYVIAWNLLTFSLLIAASKLYGCRVQLYTLKCYSNFAEHLYSPNQSWNLFLTVFDKSTTYEPINRQTDKWRRRGSEHGA